jgi:hypothetical protein
LLVVRSGSPRASVYGSARHRPPVQLLVQPRRAAPEAASMAPAGPGPERRSAGRKGDSILGRVAARTTFYSR